MVGVGAAKLGHIVTFTQFHITKVTSESPHHWVFLKSLRLLLLRKPHLPFKRILSFPGQQRFLLRIGVAGRLWLAERVKERGGGELRTSLFQPGGPKGGFLVITAWWSAGLASNWVNMLMPLLHILLSLYNGQKLPLAGIVWVLASIGSGRNMKEAWWGCNCFIARGYPHKKHI